MKTVHRTLAFLPSIVLTAAVGLAACNGGESRNAADANQVAARDTTAAMSGMGGMEMQSMSDTGMMGQMQAHMRTMSGVGADSMQAWLPRHREMVTNMMAQFDKDMRGMGMQTDAAWNATVDSLRTDLTRMQTMSSSELHQAMPAHESRVRRLMESHRRMTSSMKM